MNASSDELLGLPFVSGAEDRAQAAMQAGAARRLYPGGLGGARAACAVALHMHQPLIPAGGADLRTAALISNLQYMDEHPGIGDNHNAPVFRWCYRRMGEIVPQLVGEGAPPRVMLEYSGTLLHGLRLMGADDVLDALHLLHRPEYQDSVEWLGAPWGHAVAPSTPVQDYRRHVQAWQQEYAAQFGWAALERVRGFSPAEMALPNHPDVAYEFVRTLKGCGYQWVLVQEHSVEQSEDGRHPQRPHLPHRLVCTNSRGETAEIIAIVKTQGSDTKLVGQMQPWYEACGLNRVELAGRLVPPLVTQIADGENGGVMMNEFLPKFRQVAHEATGSAVPLMNVSEYLEGLFDLGIQERELPALRPVFQGRIWERMQPGDGPERLEAVVAELRREGGGFHMEGGSWTNNLSWVRGYETLLGPMEEVSSLFHEKASGIATGEPRYRNALYHLLVSQTSCYRYWGQGLWTGYGREVCRRARDILTYDF